MVGEGVPVPIRGRLLYPKNNTVLQNNLHDLFANMPGVKSGVSDDRSATKGNPGPFERKLCVCVGGGGLNCDIL